MNPPADPTSSGGMRQAMHFRQMVRFELFIEPFEQSLGIGSVVFPLSNTDPDPFAAGRHDLLHSVKIDGTRSALSRTCVRSPTPLCQVAAAFLFLSRIHLIGRAETFSKDSQSKLPLDI